MTVYVDTSAVAKLLLAEGESDALAAVLRERRRVSPLVSSWLLYTELHCAVARRPDDVSVADVRSVLSAIALADVVRDDLTAAPRLPGRLRANDAIHLATALRVGADTIVSYDAELNAAAEAAGLVVLSPS